MENIAFKSLAILGCSFGILLLVDYMSVQELTIERATEPVQHLSDARHFIARKKMDEALYELDRAILEMRIIEKFADSVSNAHIDTAIYDLEQVEIEIRNDSLVIADLNRAFFNALNSIAYACLKISENNIDRGEKYKAMQFMNATFSEMITSLQFVNTEDLRHKEEKVIQNVRHIIKNMKDSEYLYRFNYDTINHELEELIEF